MENEHNKTQEVHMGGGLVSIIWLVVAILIIWWLWGTVSGAGKYQGYTAEEWFNQYNNQYVKYQTFRECVEDFDNFDLKTKLSYGGVFYYCE